MAGKGGKDLDFTLPSADPCHVNKSIPRGCIQRELGFSKKKGGPPKEFLWAAEDNLVKKPFEEMKCHLPGNSRSTFLMVFSPDGTKVASTHGDHNVYVTDLPSGKNVNTLSGHPRTPWCLAFHPSSNQILASGCLGGQVRVWDLHGGSEVWTAESQTVIASLAFHPTDRMLVIATYNELHFWDWSQPHPFTKCFTGNEKEKVRYVSFDPLGHKLITGIANRPLIQSQWDRVAAPCTSLGSSSSSISSLRTGTLPEQERRITVCYRSLVEQYEQLVQRYHDLSHARPLASTIDRGTDPMDVDSEMSPQDLRSRERCRSSEPSTSRGYSTLTQPVQVTLPGRSASSRRTSQVSSGGDGTSSSANTRDQASTAGTAFLFSRNRNENGNAPSNDQEELFEGGSSSAEQESENQTDHQATNQLSSRNDEHTTTTQSADRSGSGQNLSASNQSGEQLSRPPSRSSTRRISAFRWSLDRSQGVSASDGGISNESEASCSNCGANVSVSFKTNLSHSNKPVTASVHSNSGTNVPPPSIKTNTTAAGGTNVESGRESFSDSSSSESESGSQMSANLGEASSVSEGGAGRNPRISIQLGESTHSPNIIIGSPQTPEPSVPFVVEATSIETSTQDEASQRSSQAPQSGNAESSDANQNGALTGFHIRSQCDLPRPPDRSSRLSTSEPSAFQPRAAWVHRNERQERPSEQPVAPTESSQTSERIDTNSDLGVRFGIQLLSRHIDNMQRLCRARLEILQLQQIRRMWEDLQRQIRSLHAAVRDSTNALTNSRRGRLQPQLPSETELQDGQQNVRSEITEDRNMSNIVQMSVSEMLELARISGSEEEGASNSSQEPSAPLASSARESVANGVTQAGVSESSSGGANCEDAAQDGSGGPNAPSTSSCAPAKAESLQETADCDNACAEMAPSQSEQQEESDGITATALLQPDVSENISQPAGSTSAVENQLRDESQQSTQASDEKSCSSDHSSKLKRHLPPSCPCASKSACFSPGTSRDQAANKPSSYSQLKLRLTRRFYLRKPRLLACSRGIKRYALTSTSSQRNIQSNKNEESVKPWYVRISANNEDESNAGQSSCSGIDEGDTNSAVETESTVCQKSMASSGCEKGKRKGSIHSDGGDSASSSSDAAPVETKRIRRASEGDTAVLIASHSKSRPIGSPTLEIGQPSSSQENNDEDDGDQANETERSNSSGQDNDSMVVNSSGTPEVSIESGSGANSRDGDNSEGRSRQQTTTESLQLMIARLEHLVRQQREQGEPTPPEDSSRPTSEGAQRTPNAANLWGLRDRSSVARDDNSGSDSDNESYGQPLRMRISLQERIRRIAIERDELNNGWVQQGSSRRTGLSPRGLSDDPNDRDWEWTRENTRLRARQVLGLMVDSLTQFFEQHALSSETPHAVLDEQIYNLYVLLQLALELTDLLLAQLISTRRELEQQWVHRLRSPVPVDGSQRGELRNRDQQSSSIRWGARRLDANGLLNPFDRSTSSQSSVNAAAAPEAARGTNSQGCGSQRTRTSRDIEEFRRRYYRITGTMPDRGDQSNEERRQQPSEERLPQNATSQHQNNLWTASPSSAEVAPGLEYRVEADPELQRQRFRFYGLSNSRGRPPSRSSHQAARTNRPLYRRVPIMRLGVYRRPEVIYSSIREALLRRRERILNANNDAGSSPQSENRLLATVHYQPDPNSPHSNESGSETSHRQENFTVPLVQVNDVTIPDTSLLNQPNPSRSRPQSPPHVFNLSPLGRAPFSQQQRSGSDMWRSAPQHSLRTRFLHPRYVGPNPFSDDYEDPHIQETVDNILRGSFIQDSVVIADTSVSLTHRIQAWDFSRCNIPDIKDAEKNLIVPECKIHNDASVDISSDGRLLVALLPPGRLSITTMLGIYSLQWPTLGQCLYTTSFEQNAVSVSISPTSRHLLVGLASRRVALLPTEEHIMAQIFRLKDGHCGKMAQCTRSSCKGHLHCIRDIKQGREQGYMSLNCIRWTPIPGEGLVYGTNTGQLKVLR